MKRVLIGSLTALALLAAGGISTFAHCRQYEYACSFVDENGDGICDNWETCGHGTCPGGRTGGGHHGGHGHHSRGGGRHCSY